MLSCNSSFPPSLPLQPPFPIHSLLVSLLFILGLSTSTYFIIICYYLGYFLIEYLVEFEVLKPWKQIFLGFVFENFLLLAVYMRPCTYMTHMVVDTFQPFRSPWCATWCLNNGSRFDWQFNIPSWLVNPYILKSLSQDDTSWHYFVCTKTKCEFCWYSSRGSWDPEKMLSIFECMNVCVCAHAHTLW